MAEFFGGGASDFLAATRAAEEASLGSVEAETTPEAPEPLVVEADTPDTTDVEETPEAPEAGRARDEQGRFVAAETEPEPGPDLQAEIDKLRAQLAEKDSFIGRQSNEVGELRQQMEAELASLRQQASHVQITPDFIAEDPARATQIAFEQGDQYTMTKAFEAWKYEDGFSAAAWATQKQFEQREAALRAEIEAVKSQVHQNQAPVQAQEEQRIWTQAWDKAAEANPDIRDFADVMLNDIAPQFADTLNWNGPPEVRAKALTMLYETARGRNAGTLKEAVKQAEKETADDAQQARDAAFVTSQDTAGGAAETSWEEAERLKAKELFTSKQKSLENNWVGRA
jgi:hypothetical protein